MEFAVITLKLITPLHIGKGRCGILMRSHGFVPGHLLTYALVNVIAKQNGAQDSDDFTEALEIVRDNVRCGPLFIQEDDPNKVLLPHENQQRIENNYLIASNHVTLYPENRASVEGALFEVEAISAHPLRGQNPGVQTHLTGGLWYKNESLADLSEWINLCWLGGETKIGFGRVECKSLKPADAYPGISGKCDGKGLWLDKEKYLPGPALDGVIGAPLRPWVGRLYDKNAGFGRRFSPPELVRMDGRVEQAGCFLPETAENGFGCWKLNK